MPLSGGERFTFDEEHFMVDLVFYNRLLRCFVLFDLKIGELKHQDIGQMQVGIPGYGKPFKSRLKGKKMPKIDLYPDSKSSCLSAYLRQRKPPASQTD